MTQHRLDEFTGIAYGAMKPQREGTEPFPGVSSQVIIGGIVEDGSDVKQVGIAAEGAFKNGPNESPRYVLGDEPVGDFFGHVC
jgi:hypothetical protein